MRSAEKEPNYVKKPTFPRVATYKEYAASNSGMRTPVLSIGNMDFYYMDTKLVGFKNHEYAVFRKPESAWGKREGAKLKCIKDSITNASDYDDLTLIECRSMDILSVVVSLILNPTKEVHVVKTGYLGSGILRSVAEALKLPSKAEETKYMTEIMDTSANWKNPCILATGTIEELVDVVNVLEGAYHNFNFLEKEST